MELLCLIALAIIANVIAARAQKTAKQAKREVRLVMEEVDRLSQQRQDLILDGARIAQAMHDHRNPQQADHQAGK